MKKKDILYVDLDYLCWTLSVTRPTVLRWFKEDRIRYNRHNLVRFDLFVDFMCEYQDGKYMASLLNIDYEDIDDVKEEDYVLYLNTFLQNVVLVIIDNDREKHNDVKELYGHLYSPNIMVL